MRCRCRARRRESKAPCLVLPITKCERDWPCHGSENGGTTPTIALLENLPDAIVLIDERGFIAYANAAAERLFGRPIGDLAGTALPTLLAEPYGDEYAALLRRFADGEQLEVPGERREVVAQQPDGSGVAMELA